MKINAVLIPKEKKGGLDLPLRQDKTILISAIIIASGILIGMLSFGLNAQIYSNEMWKNFFAFNTVFANKTYIEILSGLVLAVLPYFAFMILFATSAVGQFLSSMATFLKALGIGALVTYLYSNFGLKGIEYCFLVVFPAKAIFIFAMLMLTQNSLKMSKEVRNTFTQADTKKLQVKRFMLANMVILAMFSLSCLIESLCVMFFAKLFTF